MKTSFTVNNKSVVFERNWFTGSFTYSYDGMTKTLAEPSDINTHFSLTVSKTYKATVGDTVITIVKVRPMMFAGFRPHNYKFMVDGRVIKELDAL